MKYERTDTIAVKVEAWVTRRDECSVKHFAEPEDRPWKASVRHMRGFMEWEWCATFEEAVAWCEGYFLANTTVSCPTKEG